MTKATKKADPKPAPILKRCPICNKVLDLNGLCGGNFKCPESCTDEQNQECMAVIKLVLAGKIAECEGQERIQGILHPEVPF